ncbi:MAG TPA: hypothetical protein PL004_10250 [Bacillota bacterium]|nr:hypothetical protein [Bacillota bacterium]
MPNHVHGIIGWDKVENLSSKSKRPQYARLPVIVGSYKSAVTKLVHLHDEKSNFKWQKSYYDHIIRNERSFHIIENYIRRNPLKWDDDIYHQLEYDLINY